MITEWGMATVNITENQPWEKAAIDLKMNLSGPSSYMKLRNMTWNYEMETEISKF